MLEGCGLVNSWNMLGWWRKLIYIWFYIYCSIVLQPACITLLYMASYEHIETSWVFCRFMQCHAPRKSRKELWKLAGDHTWFCFTICWPSNRSNIYHILLDPSIELCWRIPLAKVITMVEKHCLYFLLPSVDIGG
jgi:hypothetical protein